MAHLQFKVFILFIICLTGSSLSGLAQLIYTEKSCALQKVVPLADGVCDFNTYKLVFEDNFDGNDLDTSKWDIITGVVRGSDFKGTKQWYTKNNLEVQDGILKIVGKRETVNNACFDIWVDGKMETICSNFEFTSGEIQSKLKLDYGMLEIRCKIPYGKGLIPAGWMYGEVAGKSSELDVFEFWNQKTITGKFDADKIAKVHQMTAHNTGVMCHSNYEGVDFSEGFHTFTAIWDPYKIEWFVDCELKR